MSCPAAFHVAKTARGYCLQLRLAQAGELLLTTPPFDRREQAAEAIDLINRHAAFRPYFHVRRDRTGTWWVSLSSSDGALIAVSGPHGSEPDADRSIKLVMAAGPHAALQVNPAPHAS
jgi:uncharacterized protein YegP (UPF0339 family)